MATGVWTFQQNLDPDDRSPAVLTRDGGGTEAVGVGQAVVLSDAEYQAFVRLVVLVPGGTPLQKYLPGPEQGLMVINDDLGAAVQVSDL